MDHDVSLQHYCCPIKLRKIHDFSCALQVIRSHPNTSPFCHSTTATVHCHVPFLLLLILNATNAHCLMFNMLCAVYYSLSGNREQEARSILSLRICDTKRTHSSCSAVNALIDAGRVPCRFALLHFLPATHNQAMECRRDGGCEYKTTKRW